MENLDQVTTHLPNGMTVTMRKYVDPGLQRDLDVYLSRLNAKDGSDPANREHRIQAGEIYLVQKLLVKVETANKTYTAPIGMRLLRTIEGPSWSELVRIVNKNNEEAPKP